MSRASRSAVVAPVVVLFLLAVAVADGVAQQKPPDPFGATWANVAGAAVFQDKGCGTCHAIRGFGPTVGPELARIQRKGFFDLGAAMSNHLRGVALARPKLTTEEVSSLIAFIFTLHYWDVAGDPKAGERLFTSKACAHCHAVGGKGGRIGPGLDFLKQADSPVLVAAALWNHGPEMTDTLRAEGIARPTFAPGELASLIAYIQSAARDPGGAPRRIDPGTPTRGERLFTERHCGLCHAIGGKGGSVGPELGRQHHVSLTEFAARMWNHSPGMTAKMRELGVQVPRLSGQDMADLVAHLYTSQYFDQAGSGERGRQLLGDKGCLACHAIRGQGPKIGADLTTYQAYRSSPGVVATLWNHPRYLEDRRQEVPWPILTGQELADMAAYLVTLPQPEPKKN